jgi:hypothetical protein
MAATATFDMGHEAHHEASLHLRDAVELPLYAALPVGFFGVVNFVAGAYGVVPLFFAPFGLPGWVGAVAHLAMLTSLGAAFWALARNGATRQVQAWPTVLVVALALMPFVTPMLDTLQLSIVCSAVFLFALATTIRVGRASALGGWLVSPVLAIVGFSAAMGLAVAAAYSPPFALMQGNQTTPAA